jgi:hypothetical protein
MRYAKPQLTQIGDARQLIANPIAKSGPASENNKPGTPAYDLDE